MNCIKSLLFVLAFALVGLPLQLNAQMKADTTVHSPVPKAVIAPHLPAAIPVFLREVKVKDPDTGSRYWLAYGTNQDIIEIRKSGLIILRTRKSRNRTKNGKAAEFWPKIIPSVIEVLPYFFDHKQNAAGSEPN